MIRGEVHDENAWSLGGVAGPRRTVLHRPRPGRARPNPAQRRALRARADPRGRHRPGDAGQRERRVPRATRTASASSSTSAGTWTACPRPVTFGHTGFTGTSVVIDPLSDSFVILLTNRVHPSRDWGSNNPARRAVARDLARAIAVRPLEGRTAWFSGVGDARTVDPVGAGDAGRRAVVRALVRHRGRLRRPHPRGVHRRRRDLVAGAVLAGRAAHDRRHAVRVRRSPLARRHGDAAARADDVLVRWRYANDAANQGRGVYVDRVRVDGTAAARCACSLRTGGAVAELRWRAPPRR